MSTTAPHAGGGLMSRSKEQLIGLLKKTTIKLKSTEKEKLTLVGKLEAAQKVQMEATTPTETMIPISVHQDVVDERDALLQQVQQMQEENQQAKAVDVQTIEALNTQLRDMESARDKERKDAVEQAERYEEELVQLQSDLAEQEADFKQKIKALQGKVAASAGDGDESSEKLATAITALKTSRAENEQLQASIDELVAQMEGAEDKFAELTNAEEEAREECARLKTQIEERQVEREKLATSAGSTTQTDDDQTLQKLQVGLDAARMALTESTDQNKLLTTDLAHATENMSGMVASQVDLEAAAEAAQRRAEEIQGDLDQANSRLLEANARVAELSEEARANESKAEEAQEDAHRDQEDKSANFEPAFAATATTAVGGTQVAVNEVDEEKVKSLELSIGKYKVVVAKLHSKLKTTTEMHKKDIIKMQQKISEMTHRLKAQKPHYNTIKNCLLPIHRAWMLHASPDQAKAEENEKALAQLHTDSAVLPDLSVLADFFMGISDDILSGLQRLHALESSAADKGGQLDVLSVEHKDMKTKFSSLAYDNAELKKQNTILDDKHAKMKMMLLRANKHMEDNKRRIGAYKLKTASLVANLNAMAANQDEHWACCRGLSEPVSLPDSKDDAEVIETSPDETYAGVAVEACTVAARLQAGGELWLLLQFTGDGQVEAPPTEDEGDEKEEKDEDSKGQGEDEVAMPAQYFWTTQGSFLKRKAQQRAESGVGGASTESERRKADVMEVVQLRDGTILPEELLHGARRGLNERFALEWQSSSAHFQHNLEDLTQRLASKDRECSQAKDDYARYKARAHSLLETRTADLDTVNRELEGFTELQAENARLQQQHERAQQQLLAQDPDQLLRLRAQVEALASHKDRLEQELHEVEDDYQSQLRVADDRYEEMTKQAAEVRESARRLQREAEAATRKEVERCHTLRVQLQERDDRLGQLEDQARVGRAGMGAGMGAGAGMGSLERKEARATPQPQPSPEPAAAASPVTPVVVAEIQPARAPSANDFLQSSLSGFDARRILRGQPSEPSTDKEEQVPGGSVDASDPTSALPFAYGRKDSEGRQSVPLDAVQAMQDEELLCLRKHVRSLQEMLQGKEAELDSRREHQAKLSKAISERERSSERERQLQENMMYLKNILMQYLSTAADHDKLFPVIAQMLQLSPQEIMRITKKREASSGLLGTMRQWI